MRIRITRGVVGEDRRDWMPGEEHDASLAFARELVARGAAEPVGTLPPAPPLTSIPSEPSGLTPAVPPPAPRPTGRRRS